MIEHEWVLAIPENFDKYEELKIYKDKETSFLSNVYLCIDCRCAKYKKHYWLPREGDSMKTHHNPNRGVRPPCNPLKKLIRKVQERKQK
jgi:hypothetical protein